MSIVHKSLPFDMELKYFPKIELHAHLSGSISDKTLSELLKNKKSSAGDSEIERYKLVVEQGSGRSLKECFEVFKVIHLLTDNLQTIQFIAAKVIDEFCEDNVYYLELRTTPKFIHGTYSKREYLETVLDTIINKEDECGIFIRLLISIDRGRGVSDAAENVQLAKELKHHEKYGQYICGIDVSGDPYCDSLVNYIPILKEAKSASLKLAVHLLEINTDIAFEEAKELITRGLVDRIGHATYLHPLSDGCKALTALVKEKKIPIEICITSNIKCGIVSRLEDHHLKHWSADTHPVVVCTDDKGVFTTSLGEEISQYMKVTGGSISDLHNLVFTSIDAAFLETEKKGVLRSRVFKFLNMEMS